MKTSLTIILVVGLAPIWVPLWLLHLPFKWFYHWYKMCAAEVPPRG